jgi:hypothetical protein
MIALGEILAWPCLERGGSASDQQSKHRWEQPSNLDLTRFGGQFVVSLSDSLPSSNV